jgi:hypothetical protein
MVPSAVRFAKLRHLAFCMEWTFLWSIFRKNISTKSCNNYQWCLRPFASRSSGTWHSVWNGHFYGLSSERTFQRKVAIITNGAFGRSLRGAQAPGILYGMDISMVSFQKKTFQRKVAIVTKVPERFAKQSRSKASW